MAWDNNRPKHVPTPVRDACLQRDGHQCTQTMRNGQRCPETTNLEAAHIGQWHEGEHTTINMVRTLCRWHHNIETQAEARDARAKRQVTRPKPQHPGEQHPALR